MNILVIHNTYQQPGGEDVVVDQETRLLQRHGHKVAIYKRSNDEIDHLSFAQRLGLIGRILSANDSRLAVRCLIREIKPDVVHVHNTFLMVSPSVYEVCLEEGIPVVQTLHNYRLLCPASTLYRDDAPCEECVTDGLLRSVRHGCYRDSRLMSGVVALMLQTHRSRQTWGRGIAAYIAISNFVRKKFIQAGIPAEKISVKPHFVDPDPRERYYPGDCALFLGRLSPEKGLSTLLRAWESLRAAIPLVIAGDGPMRRQLEAEVARKGLSHVHFAGRLRRDEAYGAIKKAAFLVVPSVWHEPFGLVVAEAFACGTPVLGASVGAIQEMLEHERTGLHFEAGNAGELAERVAWAWKHAPELAAMGKAARRTYEDRYTAGANYELLMNIYERAIDAHTTADQTPTLAPAI
jgi:glycosyltransferase involved in cell wall biosynthesis